MTCRCSDFQWTKVALQNLLAESVGRRRGYHLRKLLRSQTLTLSVKTWTINSQTLPKSLLWKHPRLCRLPALINVPLHQLILWVFFLNIYYYSWAFREIPAFNRLHPPFGIIISLLVERAGSSRQRFLQAHFYGMSSCECYLYKAAN